PMGDYSLGAHAATLRDLLDHLEIERVTLVGHSLGGGITMQFHYLFPERVDRVVLIASGGLGREVNPLLRSATLPGADPVLRIAASTAVTSRAIALSNGMSKVGWRPGSDINAIWRGFTALADSESRRAFLATTRAVIDAGGQSITAVGRMDPENAVPTLVVWGSHDRIIPAWHALSAQKAIPDCRVEVFENAGHFPHLEDPDRFAELLREFIAEDSSP
ncbi:MAG TPA: alpha/beta fold hydrolase, partial [Ornithinicoccus sp.]|nr:alpha/beta fold hydrolase [Ornithinicoccus sp.]